MKEYLFHSIFILYSILIYTYRFKISKFLNLLDYPDSQRKSHYKATPAIGGLIILPYLFFSLFALYLETELKIKLLFIWSFLLFSFFITGLIDDRINLNAKNKTFILLFVLFTILPLDSSLLINSLVFKDVKYVILLNQGSLFFTIFCVYFYYNSLNFSDGLNGISITSCIYVLSIIIFLKGSINLLDISLIIGLITILIPNLFGRIFLGNSGVSLLSCLVFIYTINFYNEGIIFFDEIILLFFLPTIDTVRITIERILKGNSPFLSDRNHLHHLMTKIIDKKFVVIPYIVLSISPYLIFKLGLHSYFSFIIFVILYSIVLTFLKLKDE